MQIDLYTKMDCKPCKRLKRWLENNGFEYEEKHIEQEDLRTYIKSFGVKLMPTAIIDGDVFETTESIKEKLSVEIKED